MIDTVAPSAPAAPSPDRATPIPTAPGGKLGKDEFLKLLVAQMKNQDPTSPLKGEELAAQLAQFSSLEQLLGINESLSGQVTATAAVNEAVSYNTAASTIGRTVTAVGDQVAVTPGQDASVTVMVGGAGGDATLRLYDANGNEVGSRELGTLAGGEQQIDLGSATTGLSDGVYSYKVEVRDATGASVDVTTFTTGRVDRVEYSSMGPVLGAGKLNIAFGNVVRIAA